MKRLLDRLMYKLGYVTKERYLRAAAPKVMAAFDEWNEERRAFERHMNAISRQLNPPIVITTDYRKGTPCS